MLLQELIGSDWKTTLQEDSETLQSLLENLHPEDVAKALSEASVEDAVEIVRAMHEDFAADVLERLPLERQVSVLHTVDTRRAVTLLGEMDPDDRVDLLQELPEDEAEALLSDLAKTEPEAAEEVRELVAYDPETAGGIMTTEYVSLPPETKAADAIESVRRIGSADSAETLYYIYVCGYGNKLLGVLSLRDLILADPIHTLSTIMEEKVVSTGPFEDQEKVALTIARYDLSAIPVVDHAQRMLGVVTIDDLVDVVIEEATEDAQKMGGVVPLEDAYFATRWVEFAWKRGAWLVVLFLGQLLTASVIENNQDLLTATVELVAFIPLIISSGGNAGSQSATLIIRAMAVGELKPGDWLRVFGRELGIGILLGVGLGLIGFSRAWMSGYAINPLQLATSVGVSILAIVTLSSILGSLLPIGMRRIGLDPAVSSAPFIASLVDVFGLIVYFALAQIIFSIVM